jgi:hypothetical protein
MLPPPRRARIGIEGRRIETSASAIWLQAIDDRPTHSGD